MAATSSLKIGSADLTDSFHDIIHCFEHIECEKNDEALQLGLLKLRLCRWRDAIVQLAWTSEETPEGADANFFNVFLSVIKTSLGPGAERVDMSPPVKETSTARDKQLEEHWLVEMLEDLAAQHRGPSQQPSSADSRPKTAVPRTTLMAVKGLVDQLEVVGLKGKLKELRSLDANALKMNHRICEQDINLLKASAVAVDPELGTLLHWGGGTYSDIKANDHAIGHYGNNIGPGETSTRATYQRIEAGGYSISHFGDNIGNYPGRTLYDSRQENGELVDKKAL